MGKIIGSKKQAPPRSPIIKITQDSSQSSLNRMASQAYNQVQANPYEICNKNEQQLEEEEDQQQQHGVDKQDNGNNSDSKIKGCLVVGEEQTHAYKRRFFVLLIFCSFSAVNSFQWIEYSSITGVVAEYYEASNLQVNLTSLVYMITYIPFIIHASLMLERVGLRKAIILGTLGTAIGSLFKWQLGGAPGISSFWWLMFGQTIVALSQLYIISIPPLLAAVWFPDNQVSTATGIGVFGNQLGIALGFIIPPLVIRNPKGGSKMIGEDLNCLSSTIFWISSAICIISILSLDDKPPKPPGSASYHAAHQDELSLEQQHNGSGLLDNQQQLNSHKMETFHSIGQLVRDSDFRLLILSYGINVGCFYAVSTVLNQMVALRWPDLIDLAGTLGLLIVVSGMLGSVLCGQLLDRFHAYKLIIVFIYLFSLISMLLFTLVLEISSSTQLWPLYLAAIVLGFFMTGYLPLGFEFAAEITYPHPANTPAGLLNLSAQVSIVQNTLPYNI